MRLLCSLLPSAAFAASNISEFLLQYRMNQPVEEFWAFRSLGSIIDLYNNQWNSAWHAVDRCVNQRDLPCTTCHTCNSIKYIRLTRLDSHVEGGTPTRCTFLPCELTRKTRQTL